jgi:transposase
METGMPIPAHRPEALSAVRVDLGAIFVSMELSQSKWLITSLSPGNGEKLSKFIVGARDVVGMLARFADLQRKAQVRVGQKFPLVVIQEAGLDGFWIHRVLEAEGIESHVVDAASIAVSRRRRRVKTDKIDGEMLVRTLLAYKRGEPRVCAMVRVPTPEDEDRRRLSRERKSLTNERVRHVNRIKGLLFGQGINDYEPLRRDRRKRLDELTTGDGRALPAHLKAQIARELGRLELAIAQIKECEQTRDALLATPVPAAATQVHKRAVDDEAAQPSPPSAPAMLLELKGIGPEIASVLWFEGLSRQFDNRRQVAAYAGLAPSHWQSGKIDHDQGVSKAGNSRLRTSLIQLAWLWVQHQPASALTLWFKERVAQNGGRLKKTAIVALARKLLVALWKYVNAGVIIEGAVVQTA